MSPSSGESLLSWAQSIELVLVCKAATCKLNGVFFSFGLFYDAANAPEWQDVRSMNWKGFLRKR
jgi:hypothetical protein